MGFVEQRCSGESCLIVKIEPGHPKQGELLRVFYDAQTLIYDPENYELTFKQAKFPAGAHLRLMLIPEINARGYRANAIWIGD